MQTKILKLALFLGLVFPIYISADDIKIKKQNFFKLVVPAVDKVYNELNQKYKTLKKYIDNNETQNSYVNRYMQAYKAKNHQDLLKKVKPHPKSIAIAQAAIESGWATSRFTKVANNLFGVWSFNKNEPRVPAIQKRGNKIIYVKKYKTIADSIRDYYKVLALGRSYDEFRELKMKVDNPYKLVKKLNMYSEKRAKYSKELAQIIKHNKLYSY
ncbi:MAG: glucosaminidase domain-containing protein [Thiovulaceae bacterium]|nr:glucosaminidase domain-containing protein [Sulfurimonadaceae bacterium]